MKAPKIIQYGLVGSRGYGVSTPESDYDYMGVLIEPEEAIFGLKEFEQTETVNEEGQIKVYGLRKYVRMLLKGSPNATELLWVKPDQKCSPYTEELFGLRHIAVSKRTLRAYSGYMAQQIKKLTTGRGANGKPRAELIEKFGYDTKFAYHVLRLGMMGQTLGQTCRLYMPLDQFQVAILKEVREGRWSETKILNSATTMKEGIDHWIRCSDLPEEPNVQKVEEWLISVFRREYGRFASV